MPEQLPPERLNPELPQDEQREVEREEIRERTSEGLSKLRRSLATGRSMDDPEGPVTQKSKEENGKEWNENGVERTIFQRINVASDEERTAIHSGEIVRILGDSAFAVSNEITASVPKEFAIPPDAIRTEVEFVQQSMMRTLLRADMISSLDLRMEESFELEAFSAKRFADMLRDAGCPEEQVAKESDRLSKQLVRSVRAQLKPAVAHMQMLKLKSEKPQEYAIFVSLLSSDQTTDEFLIDEDLWRDINEEEKEEGQIKIRIKRREEETGSLLQDAFKNAKKRTDTLVAESTQSNAQSVVNAAQEAAPVTESKPLINAIQNVSVVQTDTGNMIRGFVGSYALLSSANNPNQFYIEEADGSRSVIEDSTVAGLNDFILKKAEQNAWQSEAEEMPRDPYDGRRKEIVARVFKEVDVKNNVLNPEEIRQAADIIRVLHRNSGERKEKDVHPLRVLGLVDKNGDMIPERVDQFSELFKGHMEEIRDWTFNDMRALANYWGKIGKYAFISLIQLKEGGYYV